MMKFFTLFFALLLGTLAAKAETITIDGNISASETWTRNNVYILAPGFHYVIENATLTIESGTVVRGDEGTLVVTQGAKLVAVGTSTEPIVFTSNKTAGERAAGDWGGIVICGRGIINVPTGTNLVEGGLDATFGQYGGTVADDNSGHLSYIRIEYAGKFYQANSELNSLTLAGVGSGTTINHVQCSHGLDDAFEWFGGAVDASNLVAFSGLDDDFDTDFGYSGRVQFAVSLRDPNVADVSGSNGFESDNDATGSTNGPITGAKFSNVTIFGPIQGGGNVINANYKRGAHLRRSTQEDIYNSVILGYPVGLKIENTNTGVSALAGDLQFNNNILAGCTLPLETASTDVSFVIDAWYAASYSDIYPTVADAAYVNPYTLTAPDFRATNISSVLVGANFDNLPDFFVPTTYRGAFDNNAPWTNCWTEFDPQNATYDAAINYLSASITPTGTATIGAVLTAEAGNDYTYQWLLNDIAIEGATAQTYTVATAGNFACQITSPRGCVKTTASVTVLTVGTEDNFTNNIASLQVSPNPNNGNFTATFRAMTSQNTVTVSVFDVLGKQVATRTIDAVIGKNTVNFDATNLIAGIYIVRVVGATSHSECKILVN